MAYTNIDDPSAHFQVATYNNNGSTITVTNDGNSDLQPDLIWNKQRTNGGYHGLWDSSRGTSKSLSSNVSVLEILSSGKGITAFNTDGFTGVEGSYAEFNQGSQTSVAWQWKANGGTTASNTDGNTTTTVQANTDAGFSIVTYTGTGSGSQTMGHGLGVTPNIVLTKARSGTSNWSYNSNVGPMTYGTNKLLLNTDAALTADTNEVTAASSTTFTGGGSAGVNSNGATYVAYCFAEKQGYSKFGSYVGNGNGNGPFVYTGFKPAFVMFKRSTGSQSWDIHDSTRDPFNPMPRRLLPNLTEAEETRPTSGASIDCMDFLSNGFKIRSIETILNASGDTFVYMAFAENPFVTSTGIPTTAR